MLDIKNRIHKAIFNFTEVHNYEPSYVYLSRTNYAELHLEAESMILGRNFLKVGNYNRFCDLEIKIHSDGRDDICIC